MVQHGIQKRAYQYLTQLEEAEKEIIENLGKKWIYFIFKKKHRMVFWHPQAGHLYSSRLYEKNAIFNGYEEIRTQKYLIENYGKNLDIGINTEKTCISEIDEEHANEKRTNALKPMNCLVMFKFITKDLSHIKTCL